MPQPAPTRRPIDTVKNMAWLTFGTLVMAIGVYFFKFPNAFNFGGVTGVSVLIASTGLISAADINLIINVILLGIGAVMLGRGFMVKTAYCSLLLSGSVALMERLFPLSGPLTDQPMLELCFGIAFPAIGAAILFNMNGSSGGTDIIAMILKKYTSLNIGRALLLTDCLIVLSGFFVFDIRTELFSILGMVVSSFLVDNVIESINLSKYFNIICSNPKPILDFIIKDLNRSATVTKAMGAFSGEDRTIIFTAMNRRQAIKLRAFIHRVEPTAFVLIASTSEIIGKGFHGM